MFKYEVVPGPYFAVFGLNTDRYSDFHAVQLLVYVGIGLGNYGGEYSACLEKFKLIDVFY